VVPDTTLENVPLSSASHPTYSFHMLQFRSLRYLIYSAYLRQPCVPRSQRSVRYKPSELLGSLVMFKLFQRFLSDFGEPISNDSGTRGVVRLYSMIGRYCSESIRRGKEVKRCLPCSERWRSLSFVPRFVRGWPYRRVYNRHLQDSIQVSHGRPSIPRMFPVADLHVAYLAFSPFGAAP